MMRRAWGVVFVALVATRAHAGGLEPDRPTPFDRGRWGFSAALGTQTAFGHSYFSAGAGVGYFVLDGLEIGLFGVHEFGDDPSISELSPSVQYIAQPLANSWPVIPYAAGFYNHWFLGSGFSDLDTVGARGGIVRLQGRAIVGLGVAYEHIVSSTCRTDCDLVYPDITLGFTF